MVENENVFLMEVPFFILCSPLLGPIALLLSKLFNSPKLKPLLADIKIQEPCRRADEEVDLVCMKISQLHQSVTWLREVVWPNGVANVASLRDALPTRIRFFKFLESAHHVWRGVNLDELQFFHKTN